MAELGPRARKAERRHAQATETALSACQEELRETRNALADAIIQRDKAGAARDKLYGVWRREQVRGDDAEAARDELARAGQALISLLSRYGQGGPFRPALQQARDRWDRALSSEATKGET